MPLEMTTDGRVLNTDTRSHWSKMIPFRQQTKTASANTEKTERERNPVLIPPHVIRTAREIVDHEVAYAVTALVTGIEGMAGINFLKTTSPHGQLDISLYACVMVVFSCLLIVRVIDLGLLMEVLTLDRQSPGYSKPEPGSWKRLFLCGPVLSAFLFLGSGVAWTIVAWTIVMRGARVSETEPWSMTLFEQVLTAQMIGVLLIGAGFFIAPGVLLDV